MLSASALTLCGAQYDYAAVLEDMLSPSIHSAYRSALKVPSSGAPLGDAPGAVVFEGVGGAEHRRLVPGLADQLQSQR